MNIGTLIIAYRCLTVILFATFSGSVQAKQVQGEDLPVSQTLVLKAASYLDIIAGKLVTPAVIIIDQGRITAINPKSVPSDAQLIDLGSASLMPGLIDVHTHLMIGTNDTSELVRRASNDSETDFILEAMANGYKTLMAGFTTVRDLDSWYFVDVNLSKQSAGDTLPLPRIIPAGHGINKSSSSDFSHFFPPVESLPQVGIADNKQELIEAVNHQAKMGAGVIKLYGTAGFTMSEYSDKPVGAQTYTDEEVTVVVNQARKHGLKVATHAHGSDGILASVKAGVASIEHGSFLTDEIIHEMKARGTFLVLTTPIMNQASLSDPHLPPRGVAVIKQGIQSHKRAIKAGVKIAFGTDAGLYPHGKNADGIADLIDYGMTPAQAIRTATISAAELLGVEDRGVIQLGKLADIIAVAGNPLSDISVLKDIGFVMKNGNVYKFDPAILSKH